MSETRTFSQTAAALVEFDAGVAKRTRAWRTAETIEDVVAAEQSDARALRAVQDAYHRDTFDINSLGNCHRVDLGFMRRMAARSAPAALVTQQADPDDFDEQTGAPAPR
jgi:hypothetical protein